MRLKSHLLKLFFSLTILLSFVLVVKLFNFSSERATENKAIPEVKNKTVPYQIKQPYIPEKPEFAGEYVPIEFQDVKESLDREFLVNTYWHSNTILLMKRAHKFFPVIEPILKKNSIPDDFKYLAVAESGLSNVVSPSGAKGFWQFLKNTAREYGLEVNSYVDERYNLELATNAACEYLNKAYSKYGSWSMVAASYNMGMTGLDRQVAKQNCTKYYDLLLNSETGRYVYRIIALKYIFANPQEYGFNFAEKDLYFPLKYETYIVDTAVNNLTLFAEQFGITYKTLKYFNPWLRDKYLVNKSRKKYEIKIPVSDKIIRGSKKEE